MSEARCDVCGRAARYAFPTTGGGADVRCGRHAVAYPRVRDRALGVGLVVGTILFAINQLDVVLSGAITPLLAAKVALTYLVPYSVATYSALEVSRRR
ncbi:MAG TPA: nitrate/nitrite transporter NrtS [Candidatus Limnocylindria bacterium]|nr:nitrate/nitrite transporter NrtS [Candidatus Limnocylindria bacterium]